MEEAKASMAVTQRADAKRSRTRILAAADVVFRAEGANAPLEQVIREAKIGRMTFFRHFPDRGSLLAALLELAMDELQKQADLVRGNSDGLERIIAFMVERMALRTGLVEYWESADPQHPAVREAMSLISPIFADAISTAKMAGRCRDDLTPGDMALFGRMLGAVTRGYLREDRENVSARAAQLLAEGVMRGPYVPP